MRATSHRCAIAVLLLLAAVSAAAPALAAERDARAGSSSQSLQFEGTDVRLDLDAADFSDGARPLVAWVERSMTAVAGYYGRFPVPRLRIRMTPTAGAGVRHGTTYGGQWPSIRLQVGREVTAAQLREDWILVHEMVHLALPEVGDEHVWLAEGLATYVESVARVQAGALAAERVWAELMHSMPQGLPQSGDQGLDRTHTWGRTYWGGAMFCLLADVEIRSRTGNRSGLQDALRAVARSSGGISFDWPIARVLSVGDAAVGTSVLSDLYAQMKDRAVSPDLPGLWQRLGIERRGRTAQLRDDAPLAATRDAIMRKPPRGPAAP